MSAPAVVIVVDFESRAPRVIADYLDESDERRMVDWLEAHPSLADLVARALDLAAEERAA